jgi:hypothetical protein
MGVEEAARVVSVRGVRIITNQFTVEKSLTHMSSRALRTGVKRRSRPTRKIPQARISTRDSPEARVAAKCYTQGRGARGAAELTLQHAGESSARPLPAAHKENSGLWGENDFFLN